MTTNISSLGVKVVIAPTVGEPIIITQLGDTGGGDSSIIEVTNPQLADLGKDANGNSFYYNKAETGTIKINTIPNNFEDLQLKLLFRGQQVINGRVVGVNVCTITVFNVQGVTIETYQGCVPIMGSMGNSYSRDKLNTASYEFKFGGVL